MFSCYSYPQELEEDPCIHSESLMNSTAIPVYHVHNQITRTAHQVQQML